MKTIKYISLILLAFLSYNVCAQKNSNEELTYEFDKEFAKINPSLPLFINGNIANKDVGANVAFSCIITPFSPGIPPIINYYEGKRNIQNGRSAGFVLNLPVKRILQHLYGKLSRVDSITTLEYVPVPIPSSRILFKDIDTAGLVAIVNGNRLRKNSYSIQLTSSSNLTDKEIREQMIKTLELQFGLRSKFEKRTKKCVVISRTGLSVPEYSGGPIEMKIGRIREADRLLRDTDKGIIKFNNVPIEKFIDMMEGYFHDTDYPIVDETGFTKHLGLIDFLTEGPLTIKKVSENLEKYGMKFTIEDRVVDVLVVSSRK